jgi:hypothetical protein
MNMDTLSYATTKMMFCAEIKKAVVSLNFRTTFRPQQQSAGNAREQKGRKE